MTKVNIALMNDFNKKVMILNGSGGVGKGTFISKLNKYINVYECSIINKVKDVMKYSGIPIEQKTEDVRKAMSDIKLYLEKWDIPYKDIEHQFIDFICNPQYENFKLFSVDMREQKDIERFAEEYGSIKVLVVNDRVEQITSNIADAGVYDVEYDYIVYNNGTLEDLEDEALKFINWLFKN